MWIFTTRGFVSIVAWKGCRTTFCVRARAREHLEALFPRSLVMEWEGADYPFRVRVHRSTVMRVVRRELANLAYTDFKSQLEPGAYKRACSEVWGVMHEVTPRAVRYQDLPQGDLLDDPFPERRGKSRLATALFPSETTYGTDPAGAWDHLVDGPTWERPTRHHEVLGIDELPPDGDYTGDQDHELTNHRIDHRGE